MSTSDPKDTRLYRLSGRDQENVLRMIRKGASRRDVLRMMSAAGASAAFGASVFGSASRALAQTPVRGGRLSIAFSVHGPNDTLDPILFTSGIDFFRGRMHYSSLTRLENDLSYSPEIAEEIIPNEDASVWTFKLRQGVEFHDGKTLTADDVIYSMNRHLGADTVSKAAALVSMIDRWEKVNDYEVRAVLSSPNADLPIALGTFHFKIVADGTEDFSTANGTGPFRVSEFTPGVRSVGSRFENYWDNNGPYLDELETYGITDSVSRLNAFLAGDVDIIDNLPPASIETVQATDGREIWSTESSAYVTIANRLDMEMSSNRDLILAMQHLMDRQRMVRGVYKDQGALGNDQPIGPAYLDHCADIPQRELDPDLARFHFERSGVGSTSIPIITAEIVPGAVDQVLFLQREAANIGMNIDVQRVDTAGYWGAVWMNAPICAASWNMRPTANVMMSLVYKSDAAWNETFFRDEQFDQLLVSVRAVTDPDARRQAYCDLQTMIHERSGSTIPAFRNFVDGRASYVQGMTYVPLNTLGGAECPQYLWRNDT